MRCLSPMRAKWPPRGWDYLPRDGRYKHSGYYHCSASPGHPGYADRDGKSRKRMWSYEGRVVLRIGIAQGGIIDTPEGDWYAYMFRDYGSVGRIRT